MLNNIEERIIVLNGELIKRLDEMIAYCPGLTLSSIVKEALENWLVGYQVNTLNREQFITDAPEGFGPSYSFSTFNK